MGPICILGDAHLLYQAEWIDDENALKDEATEVLDNFDRALMKVSEESPSCVIFAGDMFDTRAQSGQRVAHREAEKYMTRIRKAIASLVATSKCNIYVLKGNHDSQPVLSSLSNIMSNHLTYVRNKVVEIGKTRIALLDTHYETGSYEIPVEELPSKADFLVMHESVPLPNVLAPSRDTVVEICGRFKRVFNGHMHQFQDKTLGIDNLCLLPAFIPSRDIKGNWMVKYSYSVGTVKQHVQQSPFGYIVLNGEEFHLNRYTPLQTIVRVELAGKDAKDFLEGIEKVYTLLMEGEDKKKVRVWVFAATDRLTVDRLLKERISAYPEIKTIDVIPVGALLQAPIPEMTQQLGDAAFTLDELVQRVMQSLSGNNQELAKSLFEKIFTPQLLANRHPDEPGTFRNLLEVISRGEQVSDSFVQRVWDLTRGMTR